MSYRDEQIFDKLSQYYSEIQEELESIHDNFNEFEENMIYRKAIMMDVFQIGELFNSMSEKAQKFFSKKDVRGICDIRNHIAHGYVVINNKVVWNIVHDCLPYIVSVVNEIKENKLV